MIVLFVISHLQRIYIYTRFTDHVLNGKDGAHEINQGFRLDMTLT